MALRAKVLQIKAGKYELKSLEVHTDVIKEQVYALEPVLQDVYDTRRPKPSEYEVRKDLTRIFNMIAKEIFESSDDIPVVVEFGSFVMDLFSTSSDLDLSVNFNINADTFPREKKIQTLRKFAKKLYAIQRQGHVKGVLPVTTAKVPILKCIDLGTGVECDISVENRDGIKKSQIIYLISSIDERFHKLSFLMKNWAKAHNINSSKDRTLNSLSIILLVAFHLQTRNPPILPPFSAIFEDGTNPEAVAKSLGKFVDYGKNNKESLAELFVTLLLKLKSVEKLWAKGLCASTCEGSWISKTWDSKVAHISVEDFTDRTQNVARAVGQAEVKQINNCIEMSLRYIFSFMNSQMPKDRFRDILFGHDGIPTNIPKNLQQQIAGKGKGKKRKKQEAIMLTHQLKSNPIAITKQANFMPTDQLKSNPTAVTEQANVMPTDQLKIIPTAITEQANVMPTDQLKIIPTVITEQANVMPTDQLKIIPTAITKTDQLKIIPTAITKQANVMPIDQLKIIPMASCSQGKVKKRKQKATMHTGQLKSNPIAIMQQAKVVPMTSSQSRQVEPIPVRRTGVNDPWVGKPNTGWAPHVESRVGHPTYHVQQHTTGWPTGRPSWRGPPQAGWGGPPHPSALGWGEIPQASWAGWGAPPRPSGPTWGGPQQPSAPGWAATPQAPGWGVTQQANGPGWGGNRQPGQVRWVGTQPPNGWLEWNQ